MKLINLITIICVEKKSVLNSVIKEKFILNGANFTIIFRRKKNEAGVFLIALPLFSVKNFYKFA